MLPIALLALACSDFDRVLGLSGEQAPGSQSGSARPEERRAVELSRTIPGLGGFFYDTSGNVIVAVKNRAAPAVTRARLQPLFGVELTRSRRRHPKADLIVREAQYTFLELKDWRDRLEAGAVLSLSGVLWLDLDEVTNRVVVGVEPSADIAAIRSLGQKSGVPAAAFDIQQSAPYVPQSTLQDQFRPVQGGTQIQRVVGASRATCTLGFAALWNSQQVFLTAGHCSPNVMGADSVAQFQPIAPLTPAESATTIAIGREIFRYSVACGNRRCASSDAAIYGQVPSQAWQLGRIARPTSGCMPGPCSPLNLTVGGSWVIDTTRASFIVNDLVSKIGSSTGSSQGLVSRTCVDVSPVSGATYRCQMFATYGADDGDSGAPILLDIQGGSDSTVTLGGIHSGKSGNNAVFSPWSGIAQDYGSLAVVPAPQDTTRPPVPTLPNLPADTVLTVELPGVPRSEELFYRSIIGIIFDDTTSGSTVRGLFARYSGTIIGGVPGDKEYFVQIPDPGPTFAALDSIVTRLNEEVGVKVARHVYRRWRVIRDGRYPNDGPGAQRANWAVPNNATRPLLQIRAALAWGCETGAYTAHRVPVGVLDMVFDTLHPDLPGRRHLPPVSPGLMTSASLDSPGVRGHGTAVAGVLAARGDNGLGIAGMLWASDLTLYQMSTNGSVDADPMPGFSSHIDDAIAHGVRVIVFTAGVGRASILPLVARVLEPLRRYLSAGGLIVLSTGERLGQSGVRLTVDQLATTQNDSLTALKPAAALLYSTGYADQIIWVAGTDDGGAFWLPSNFWSGATLVAPATNILTLDNQANGQTTNVWQGTSFSAPYVAGVAGQLLAMDSTLTAAQLKDYILRGARHPRLNRQTGVFGPPQPVPGAPETVYQLDAYGALTLLASERSGVPLCGNRVWVAGTQLVAQRDTGTTPQVLADIGDTSAFVNVHHGGRRVDVWTNAFDPLSFVFNQGAWAQSGTPPASPDGGAWNSLWWLSHDGDTAVTIVNQGGAGQVTLEVRRGPAGGTSTHVADIVVPLSSSGSLECIFFDAPSGECQEHRLNGTSESIYSYWAAYSPLGDRIIVSISKALTRTTDFGNMADCPWDTGAPPRSQCVTHIDYSMQTVGTVYHQISLPTGADTVLASPTSAPVMVFWTALAEDGGQLVAGEGVVNQTSRLEPDTNFNGFHTNVTSQTTTACTLRYRQASSGLPPRFQTASENVCRGPIGGGTMAPAPRISSRSR